jgi:hypothetical protein
MADRANILSGNRWLLKIIEFNGKEIGREETIRIVLDRFSKLSEKPAIYDENLKTITLGSKLRRGFQRRIIKGTR